MKPRRLPPNKALQPTGHSLRSWPAAELGCSAYKHGAEEGCTEWRDAHEPGAADRDVRDGEIQRHR
jgi:hypothetical protein